MATRNAKIKSIKPYPPKRDGTKSIGVTFEDDKFGYFGFSEDHGLEVGKLYSYTYEDKTSAKGNAYQDITKITPVLVQSPTRQEAEEPSVPPPPKKPVLISSELRAELKTRVGVAVLHEVMDAFTKDKINEDRIKELIVDLLNSLFSEIDEFGA